MDENGVAGAASGADDWDNVPPPQSRSDRIQRITSPDGTLNRPPPHSGTLARSTQQHHPQNHHQQQQLHLAMALLQQQQQMQQQQRHLDNLLLDSGHPYVQQPPLPPGAGSAHHMASLRRQAQIMALQAAAHHTGSLPRSSQQQMFSIPASPTSSRGMRYRSPATSLPPTSGPLRPAMSPNLSSARRLSQQRQLELQLEPRHLDSLQRRGNTNREGMYWGDRHSHDPYVVTAAQQGIYSGDGSTSSYARVSSQRQTYPPQSSASLNLQNAEPMYNLQHDENTSLTSQKTSRTQASMLTKSAPTPSGSGSGASGSGSTPQQKQSSEATGSTTISASAKYAEYISNLQKYQHPPPSKRHVTFIKYRGRQCTIAMLVVFAILVIGLVVAPVVYFTAFANKATASSSAPATQMTNFINGQITLDTTHGTYADLLTDPGRPPDSALKRVQRDMEDLLKDVLQGSGGFADNDINSVTVSQPQRPDAQQIFLRFQVLLKNSQPLDVAEAKTSKAFATATTTDLVGMRLKDIPIVANSLFFRAVAQTNGTVPLGNPSEMPGIMDVQSDAGNRKSDLTQLSDPFGSLNTVSRGPNANLVSVTSSVSNSKQSTTAIATATAATATATNGVSLFSFNTMSTSTNTGGVQSTPRPTTSQVLSATAVGGGDGVARSGATTDAPQLPPITPVDLTETFGHGVGVHAKKTTTGAGVFGLTTAAEPRRPVTFPPVVAPSTGFVKTSSDFNLPMANENGLPTGSRFQAPLDNAPNSFNSQFSSVQPFSTSGNGQTVSQVPFHQGAPVPLGNTASWQNQPQFSTTPLHGTSDGMVGGTSGLPGRDFTPSTLSGKNTVSTGWHSLDNTRPPSTSLSAQQTDGGFSGPQFVQQFNPNLPAGPSVFNLNMQNPSQQGSGGFNPQFQGLPGTFAANSWQPLPQEKNPPNTNGGDTFNRGHETAFNGFRLTNSPQQNPNTVSSFPPPQSFKLNGFAADDASASTTMSEVHHNSAVTSTSTPSSQSSQEVMTESSTVAALDVKGIRLNNSTDLTDLTDLPLSISNGSEVSSATKREFSAVPSGLNMPNGAVKNVEEAQEFPEFSDTSATPILTSEWGNWSDWGSCSAPQCSNDGFQSRTRMCMTSIGGAASVPDRDASCAANGGQPIEARPCVCEREVTSLTTDDTSLTITTTTTSDPTDDDLLPTTTAVVVSTDPTTTTKLPSYLAWSEWTDWSSCSIEPCHPHGIQTRHRTCQADGLPVADQACLDQLEGFSTQTQPCDCPPTVKGNSEEVKTTTPTYVRAGGQFIQPVRTFSLQVQNRPIQRRPTTKLPGTCSAFEKPCNNGQCILSYRICDGFPDCADGSDEPLGCGRCFSGEFKCTNGRCISETLVCDGSDNCGDGSDEYFC